MVPKQPMFWLFCIGEVDPIVFLWGWYCSLEGDRSRVNHHSGLDIRPSLRKWILDKVLPNRYLSRIFSNTMDVQRHNGSYCPTCQGYDWPCNAAWLERTGLCICFFKSAGGSQMDQEPIPFAQLPNEPILFFLWGSEKTRQHQYDIGWLSGGCISLHKPSRPHWLSFESWLSFLNFLFLILTVRG